MYSETRRWRRRRWREALPSVVQTREDELSIVVILRLPSAEGLDETTVSDVLARGAVIHHIRKLSENTWKHYAQVAVDVDFAALAVIDRVVYESPSKRRTMRRTRETKRTGVLVHDALLPDVEAFARRVCPPLLQLAVLVV